MILSLFALAFIPLLDNVEDRTSDEVNNEFDCVSQRPPPTTCQRRAVVVTTTTAPTTTIADVTTTTTAETTTTAAPTTTEATTSTTAEATTTTTAGIGTTSATWTFTYRGNYDGTEYVAATFYLYDAGGQPVTNRTVSLSIRVSNGTEVSTGSCRTGSGDYAGRCFGIYRIPNSAGAVYLIATAVDGSPALSAPPEQSPTVS